MDEPLWRVAEDDGLLRTPGMRVLMLQPPAREEHVLFNKRVYDGLVRVALLALVVNDAGRAAGTVRAEAGRVLGEETGIIHGEGDGGVDAAFLKLACVLHPDVEVLPTVAGCRVHEARTGIVGDVIAGKERHGELVAAAEAL